MAAHPLHTSHRRSGSSTGLVLGIAGLCGIAALVAALVWVLEGQVQQAKVLRSQWQNELGGDRANRAVLSEAGPVALPVQVGTSATPIADKSAVVATSLNRP